MPVLERDIGHPGPARNAQRIAAPVLWLMTPAMTLFTVLLWAEFVGAWTPARIVACGVLGLAALCFAFALVSQRLFWWAPRVLAAMVSAACFGAIYLVAWLPARAAGEPRLPAVFLATLGFLLLGVPCLCFVLWGHTGAKLARLDAIRITPMDRWTARILRALHYAVLVALAFYVARTLAQLVVDSLY